MTIFWWYSSGICISIGIELNPSIGIGISMEVHTSIGNRISLHLCIGIGILVSVEQRAVLFDSEPSHQMQEPSFTELMQNSSDSNIRRGGKFVLLP